jgi:hydroxymethylglutaryl-CoA lyase
MTDFPKRIQINEEGPREGFQFEKGPIATERKIELIDALSGTGLQQIQVCSFVNPKRVPGMADADEVVQGFKRNPDVRYTALWLNQKGLERALATERLGLKASISMCASEGFMQRNQNRSFEENVSVQHTLVEMYKNHSVPIERGSIMAAFGCNFQGDISTSTVVEIVQQILDIASERNVGIKVISLADTMAWATPNAIHRVVGAVRERFPDLRLSLHLHDTRGMGIANAFAGLEMGVDIFDASVAGLGGCPFAGHKAAAGNVCTEDLVFMCHEMGIETGIDLEKLIEAARIAEDVVHHPLPGAVMKAGALDPMRSQLSEKATA